MPRKTMAALLAQAAATLPDNTTEEISPADVRLMVQDFVNSIKPGYAVLSNPTHTFPLLGGTPVLVPYTSVDLISAEDFQAAAGIVTRLPNGLSSFVTRVNFAAEALGPSGAEFSAQLFVDGVQFGTGTTITMAGAANFAPLSFSVLVPKATGANQTLEVRVAKISGAASDVDLADVRLICEVVPTLGA